MFCQIDSYKNLDIFPNMAFAHVDSVFVADPLIATVYAELIQYFMPRSHIHGSPRRFYHGLNLTDDPGQANFRSPIRMHYTCIRMIKYYYV